MDGDVTVDGQLQVDDDDDVSGVFVHTIFAMTARRKEEEGYLDIRMVSIRTFWASRTRRDQSLQSLAVPGGNVHLYIRL